MPSCEQIHLKQHFFRSQGCPTLADHAMSTTRGSHCGCPIIPQLIPCKLEQAGSQKKKPRTPRQVAHNSCATTSAKLLLNSFTARDAFRPQRFYMSLIQVNLKVNRNGTLIQVNLQDHRNATLIQVNLKDSRNAPIYLHCEATLASTICKLSMKDISNRKAFFL